MFGYTQCLNCKILHGEDALAALTKRIRNARILWCKLSHFVPEIERRPKKKRKKKGSIWQFLDYVRLEFVGFICVFELIDPFFLIIQCSNQRWKPTGRPAQVRSTGRSGYWSGRDSSTGRSSRLKYQSNSAFLQLKDTSEHLPKHTHIFYCK